MSARAATSGRRLALGTWRLIEAYGHWLSGESHRPASAGFRAGARWLGVVVLRLAASLFALVFYGSVVQRAPYLIYALPPAWAYNAWHMSDWSATPPPRGVAPDSDIDAARRRARARGAYDPNGVMCVYQAPREETKAPDSQTT